MPEPLPAKKVTEEVNTYWDASGSGLTKPTLIEVEGTGTDSTRDPLRYDLNKGDVITIRPGSPSFEETPIGNWTYGNRVYSVILEIFTREDRQRIYNIMAEIRRICHARMHSLTGFQRIQFQNFTEETNENVHIWQGSVNIQLINQMVSLETAN